MQELTGVTIDHYCLQRRLKRGGMSEIYLASDIQTQHTVAVKLVHSSNHDYCERFKREVKAIAALSHDHILPAFASGDYGDWCYLVMPYIEYGTLENKLEDGPLSLREAGIILDQLSKALQYAHERGIIHRDIKPTNVLLRDGEHVYLTDFGLVKRVGEENGLTVTGYLIGTPEYMAPELAEEPASASSDLYALGVLLYKMLSGHVPFTSSTPIATYLKHIKERPQPPSTINPALPECIDEVILRALEKEPRHRYRSVREFDQAYWQALHANAFVSTARLAKREQAIYSFVPGRIAKPQRGLSLALVVAFIFCVLPFALGFILFSNDNNMSVAQPFHITTNTTVKKTSPGTSPTKTPTPAHPANNGHTTGGPTTARAAVVTPPAPSAPSGFTSDKDNEDNKNKNHHDDQGQGNSQGQGHGNSQGKGSQGKNQGK
jgi:serine/threonine protein kinase